MFQSFNTPEIRSQSFRVRNVTLCLDERKDFAPVLFPLPPSGLNAVLQMGANSFK